MTQEPIRKAREQAPFKPFTLFLSDQRRIEIRHPDYLWIVPGGRLVAVAENNGAVEIIDLVHIITIKVDQVAA